MRFWTRTLLATGIALVASAAQAETYRSLTITLHEARHPSPA